MSGYGSTSVVQEEIAVVSEKTPLLTPSRAPSPTFTLHGNCLGMGCCNRTPSVEEGEAPCSSYQQIGNHQEPEIKNDVKQNDIVIIFAFWNAMMGTSLLAMPWAFQEAGLVQALVVMVIVGGICAYTCHLIYRICLSQAACGQIPEFAEVCEQLMGGFGRLLCATTSFVLMMGALIVYWILMVQLLYNSVASVHYMSSRKLIPGDVNSTVPSTDYNSSSSSTKCFDEHAKAESEVSKLPGWSENRTVPLFLVAVFAPILQLRSMAFFNRLAALGCTAVIFLVGCSFYKMAAWGINVDFSDVTSIHYTQLFSSNFPALSGIMGMAFFSHNSVITCFKRAKNPKNNGRNILIAYLLVVVTYCIIALAIFLSFPTYKNCIKQNFFENISQGDSIFMVLQFVYFFRMVTLFPIVSFILRVQVFTGIYGTEYPGYVGSFCGAVFMYMLPCGVHIYLDTTRRRRSKQPISLLYVAFHCVIIICGIANFISQFFVTG